MKKLITTLSLAATLVSTANAIPLIDGGVGIGQWAMDKPTGHIDAIVPGFDIPNIDLADTAGFDSIQANYAYAYIEHPIPIVPNVRLEYLDPTFDGTIASIDIAGNTYSATNSLNLKQVDAMLYYDLLGYVPTSLIPFVDIKIPAGFGVKAIDGEYSLNATGLTIPTVPVAMLMPYVYINPEVQAFGFGLNVMYKYLGSGGLYDSGMTELSVSASYRMTFIPFVEPGIEIGYKQQDITLASSDLDLDAGVGLDLETGFTGIYYGLFLEF